jgi:hypothetical protein
MTKFPPTKKSSKKRCQSSCTECSCHTLTSLPLYDAEGGQGNGAKGVGKCYS